MKFNYQTSLPVYRQRQSIIDAISDNQVVIIAGETGSGKTTQLPLICLDAGRGVNGKIICTQPRRIAAISLANYSAAKCETVPGEAIGYRVRFRSNVNDLTKVIFATDGILLAEILEDPYLSKYDTIIIDEAHERSINIDFLIGHLRTLIHKRADLRIIISSATIDTRLFSRAFGNAPVITVSGRMFPVEIIYRPVIELWKGESMDSYIEGAISAVREIIDKDESGDVLVFLPTIQDVNDLRNRLEPLICGSAAILTLHSRLTASQQQMIFRKERKRKIVIATNIAETSLTVPGIKYVIDSGLVRLERYDPEVQLTRMPVEKISRASADQRAGRCGRVENGICIRLYSEADYMSRKMFTTSEIQRVNLSGVILKMSYNGLGDPDKFMFPERPSRQAVHSALRQLYELGAINRKGEITSIGKEIARLPLDPPVARMLIYARDHDAAREIMVIASGLAIKDPFSETGNESHEFKGHSNFQSDFMRLLRIWKSCRKYLWKNQFSSKSLYRYCKDQNLSSVKMREWLDSYNQIRRICRTIKGFNRKRNAPPSYEDIHKSLLSGFYSGIACSAAKGTYNGINVDNIAIHPSSVLRGRNPKWVLFHEIVETSRIYGMNAAEIRPEWVEEMFAMRCSHVCQETWYDEERGVVRAREEVSFKGLLLLTNRHIDLEKKDPQRAHEVFINEALVNEQIGNTYRFIRHNREIRDNITLLQNKFRRPFYLGDWALAEFYSSQLQNVKNRSELNRKIKQAGNDHFLMTDISELMAIDSKPDESCFPDVIYIGKEKCNVSYLFSPEDENDGITIDISRELFESVPRYFWEWFIPFYWKQRLEIILKEYGAQLREMNLSAENVISEICGSVECVSGSFTTEMCRRMYEKYGLSISQMSIDKSKLPAFLWPIIRIKEKNAVIRHFRTSTIVLKGRNHGSGTRAEFWKDECREYEQDVFTSWNVPFLQCVNIRSEKQLFGIAGFPALHYNKKNVSVRIFFSQDQASFSHAYGVAKLLESRIADILSWEVENLSISHHLKTVCAEIWPEVDIEDCVKGIISKDLLNIPAQIPLTENDFKRLEEEKRLIAVKIKNDTVSMVEKISEYFMGCRKVLKKKQIKYEKTYLNDLYIELETALTDYADDFIANDTSVEYRKVIPEILEKFCYRIDSAYNDPAFYRSRMKLFNFYKGCMMKLTEMEHGWQDYHSINEFRIKIESLLTGQLLEPNAKSLRAEGQAYCQELLDNLYQTLELKKNR